jgi:hypothetical protein
MHRHHLSKHVVVTAVIVVVADQLTKTTAGALRSGAILPVHNPDYSLGLVSGALPVLVAGSVLGLAAFGAHVLEFKGR